MRLIDALIERIEELKNERHWSQYVLSMKSGVPQTTLISIKRKRCNSVTTTTILNLCRGFNIELWEFYNSPLFSMETLDDD